jgi:hypothetical protein
VTTVESAADALALLKDDPKAYDLVLTGAQATPAGERSTHHWLSANPIPDIVAAPRTRALPRRRSRAVPHAAPRAGAPGARLLPRLPPTRGRVRGARAHARTY